MCKVWSDKTLLSTDMKKKINKRRLLLIINRLSNVPEYFYNAIDKLDKNYLNKLTKWIKTGEFNGNK